MKTKLFTVLLIMSVSLCFAAGTTEKTTRELTAKGEIPLWLFVDKVPFLNGMENLQQTLKDDLLPDEASLAPAGGQKFKFSHREFQWRAVSLTDGYFNLVGDSPKGGRPLDYSAGYAYCVLESPLAQKVNMVIGSDDSFKVYLNGKPAGSGFYERGVHSRTLQDMVELDLKKGDNQLLVRVDNYRNDTGMYCKLLDSKMEAVKDIKVSIVREPSAAVWDFPDTLDYHYSYVRMPPPLKEPLEKFYGSRIQRTMSLLESSTASKRNKVKILFYGQSIVAGNWYAIIEKELRERYPNALIEVKNLAIGGHTAPILVRCAAQDVYPYYPDLIVFHVYEGMHTGELERIFYNIRKNTTAEILTFPHHPCESPDQDRKSEESEYYKYLAQKYNCEFVNLREEWNRYLKYYHLKRSDLLSDAIHPNDMGGKLLAEMILKHFQFNTLFNGGWFDQVKTYEARRFFEESQDEIVLSGGGWKNTGSGVTGTKAGDCLKLKFHGNRVDVIVPPDFKGRPGSAKILIDGKSPSSFPGVYAASRPSRDIVKSRPAIKRVTMGDNPIAEDWTFKITEVSQDCRTFSYEVTGSITGNDGAGNSQMPFISKSGRIRLLPEDLKPFYNLKARTDAMIGFEVKWSVAAMCLDTWKPEVSKDPSVENSYVLAQGLPNTAHTLEIIANGDGDIPVKEVRVYSPPLK